MTADPIGGVWTYAMELARGLNDCGTEILLATMGAPLSSRQREEVLTIPNLQVQEGHYKLEWMECPWADVRNAGEWLLELEKHFRPDLIHLNGYAHGALPWKAPVLVVGHSCVLSWWRAVRGEAAPAEWDHYRTAVTRGLRRASLVVAPSHAMLSALQEYYGPLPASEVIYNGRALSPIEPRAKEEIVLGAGRLWDEAKNLTTLASIGNRLPWPVWLAGDPKPPTDPAGTGARTALSARPLNPPAMRRESYPRSSRAANGMDGSDGVHQLGHLPPAELLTWFSRAAIYALPARYEPFGLSVLEAALAGCALVLGDIPSLREIWGEAALYVPPNETELLHSTLLQLISNRGWLKQMAARARARALSFTAQKMTAGYLEAYSRLMLECSHDGARRTQENSSGDSKPAVHQEVLCES